MVVSFTWNPTKLGQYCELVWASKATSVECDEIRFVFVSSHVGMDNVFTGKLVARLGYYGEGSNVKLFATPTFRVMVGDQSKPSKFTIQGVIKMERPIRIKPDTRVELIMGPFPVVADAVQGITVTQKWGFMSYLLHGNEIAWG